MSRNNEPDHYANIGNTDSSGLCRALGTPLDWDEAQKNADHVRQWGIQVCWESRVLVFS